MEAPHHGNLVAPFLGCIGEWPGTEGELQGFEVSFWTSRDCFGPADPSNPWHLGNRVGNHSMWQAANLVETEGRAGNSVAVSATISDPIKPAQSAGFSIARKLCDVEPRSAGLSTVHSILSTMGYLVN